MTTNLMVIDSYGEEFRYGWAKAKNDHHRYGHTMNRFEQGSPEWEGYRAYRKSIGVEK